MKGRVRSATRSSTKRDEAFYRYLKPGALAKLRDSKIIARSQSHDLQTQISLYLLNLPTTAATSSPSSSPTTQNTVPNQIDGFPCFALRINRPRCLQRKKLVAVTPVFSESEPL